MAISKSLGFYHEDGGCDVIYYVNEPKPRQSQLYSEALETQQLQICSHMSQF